MGKNNMYSLSVVQWNPFVGCKFDCVYCRQSFQRQMKRQKSRCIKCYNFEPHYHPKRLEQTLPRTKDNMFIFTCSNGDVSFCDTEYLERILDRIRYYSDRMFLIQSKNPVTFNRVKFPENVCLGTTIETNKDGLYKGISKAPLPSKRYKDFLKVKHVYKMLTLEPIMEFDYDVLMKWVNNIDPKVVWIGYDSKKANLVEPNGKKVKKFYEELKERRMVITKTLRKEFYTSSEACMVLPMGEQLLSLI